MKFPLALLLVPVIGVCPVLAAPGITTADVNFRAGPGTDNTSFGVLPNGTDVDIGTCDANGWCAITVDGVSGYASQDYLQSQAPLSGDGAAADAGAGADASPAYTDAELDTLVAPVALYPDSVLAQVLVAVTVPLDIVKAQRWIAANTDLAADKRAAAADAEGWDESVATLAAGFPSVIDQLGNDLDNTQALGDAVILDTDAVMAAVQRQRAKAKDLGNLASNQAQTVTVNNDNQITIAPAEPDVIYVPTYNPATVYSTAAPAPVYVETGSSNVGAAIATGAIAFAAGYAVSSVFNDDWNNNYWYGPPRIDWNDRAFYPRPGYRGDVDVNVRNNNVRVGNVNVGNDVNVGNRIGDNDRNRIGNNAGNRGWQPTPQQRANARRQVDGRGGDGGGINRGQAAANRGSGAGGARRPTPASIERGLENRGGGAQRADRPARAADRPARAADRPARVSKPKQAAAPRRAAPQRQTAFNKGNNRRPEAVARARGNRSVQRGGRQMRGGGERQMRAGGGRRGGGGHRGGGRR